MLLLFELLLLLLEFVQPDSAFIADEEVDESLNAVHPIENVYFLGVLSDDNLCFSGEEVAVEYSFGSEEGDDGFFVVVGERCNEISLPQIDDLYALLLKKVESGVVVEDRAV